MEILFADTILPQQLQPGDCLVEVPLDHTHGDSFDITPTVVCLGHHPYPGAPMGSYQLTCAAWQAWLLVCTAADWHPKRIIRSETSINFDDVLAVAILNPETRNDIMSLQCLPQLLLEIATTDVLGPTGYRSLEKQNNGASLINALQNRQQKWKSSHSPKSAATQHEAMTRSLLLADFLGRESRSNSKPPFSILQTNGATILVESTSGSVFPYLYSQGFQRVILVSEKQSNGLRRCTVGQANTLSMGSNGHLFRMPAIDWSIPNTFEPGWGGRESIGGGPRQGTALNNETLWKCFQYSTDDVNRMKNCCKEQSNAN